jgi:8-oxo-dGTP pyrophosphatase MutT (NUDIX family)
MSPKERLARFRDGRGEPIPSWPQVLRPGTTVICVDSFLAAPWRVLLHQRADNHWWGFVGGCQEIGESIQDCAIREAYEETGYVVAIERLVCVDSDPEQGNICIYPDGNIAQYTNVTFLARVIGGELQCSEESLIVRWFQVNALPTPMLRTHAWRLEQALYSFVTVPVR